MTTLRSPVVAAWAAATTWLVLTSWSRLVEQSKGFDHRLLVAIALVCAVGVGLRRVGLEWPFALSGQFLTALLVLQAQLGTSLLPTTGSTRHALLALVHALDSAAQNATPVAPKLPSIVPLLLVGGVAVHLVVDLVAVSLGRVLPASLPLLAAWVLPVSVLGSTSGTGLFLLAAGSWLALVATHEHVDRGRWGQLATHGRGAVLRSGPPTIVLGGTALLLAALLPGVLPHREPYRLDGDRPGGTVRVADPVADLQRNLTRGTDVDLMRVTLVNDVAAPSYVRVAVLDEFDGKAWRVGPRTWPSTNAVDDGFPPAPALRLPGQRVSWKVAVSPSFASDWLPLPSWTMSVLTGDAWRYDSTQLDVHRAGQPGTTAGLHYAVEEYRPHIDPALLKRAAPDPSHQASDTALPTTRPEWVQRLARQVTEGATTDYQRAVDLQEWFQHDFTYSTDTEPGSGFEALGDFLNHSRTGYCEQFAASMALLARELDMPARVSVGFLRPRHLTGMTYEFSAHDLHAWPEIWFSGVGWVGFEPTPTSHTGSVPAWSRPTGQPSPSASPSTTARPTTLPKPQTPAPRDNGAAASPEGHDARVPLLVCLVLVALAAVATTPRLVRSRRRTRRLGSSDVEDWWEELHATAFDLGVAWPSGRSPRATARSVAAHFAAEHEADAREALDRIVDALELHRYAPTGTGTATSADVTTCVLALRAAAGARVVRRATWWPRSVLRGQWGAGRLRSAESA
ncbi:transglutaminaseTgpA domain-containing protein [Nocardioides jejuensis]|uniref:transglutaminase family protein n=1 Tax=Nocardioides jejuensis TaxID=2502782 RepID=UPI001404DBD8|nr:DUF3488 and transglutaminase-like domain-containing protein [Nocardioides jejuensis]